MANPESARGATLTDAVLAAALLVLAWMAWRPGHAVESVLASEDTAIATMSELASRLDAFRAQARLDRDGDGRGETPPLEAVLRPADGFARAAGAAHARDGYWFTVLVPGPEHLPSAPDESTTPDAAESTYLLVGWPVEPGRSGMRAYLRTPLDGLLRHAADGYPYGGPGEPPAPRIALAERRSGGLQPVPIGELESWNAPRETLERRGRR